MLVVMPRFIGGNGWHLRVIEDKGWCPLKS
jgi:hypothetical protein